MLPDCDNNWAIRSPAVLKPVARLAGFSRFQCGRFGCPNREFSCAKYSIDAKKICCADLIAAGCGQCSRDQWTFDLTQDAVIEAGWRQIAVEPGKIPCKIALDRVRQILVAAATFSRRRQSRLR